MANNGVKEYLGLFKEAFKILKENHPIKFASAIAYFSLFGLPCIFLILVVILGMFFGQENVLEELEVQLSKVIGEDGGGILKVITGNYLQQASGSVLMSGFYVIVVLWLSTQLFRLFQNSLNDLWQVKPDYKNFWQRLWVERGLTLIVVLLTGLLFFASVVLEYALKNTIGSWLNNPDESWIISFLVNALTVVIVFLWFSFLYEVLPAVDIKWKTTLVGAAITTVLFFGGALLLKMLVVDRDLESLYDVVAPIILVALWVFYSALVFLYGASLTVAFSTLKGKKIEPESYAYNFETEKKGPDHK